MTPPSDRRDDLSDAPVCLTNSYTMIEDCRGNVSREARAKTAARHRSPASGEAIMPEMQCPQTGADVLVRRLREHGVRHVFGYPGGQMTPLYDALHREPGIRHILARDEQA